MSVPRSTYSRYFPVLRLNYSRFPNWCEEFEEYLTPCFHDEIYFDIRYETPANMTEITQEEFNAEFDKCIERFKEQIDVRGDMT